LKRAALLLLLVGAPHVLALFPGLILALGRGALFFLVHVSGLLLAAGVATAFSSRFEALGSGERITMVVGLALLGTAWIGVARSALRR